MRDPNLPIEDPDTDMVDEERRAEESAARACDHCRKVTRIKRAFDPYVVEMGADSRISRRCRYARKAEI